MNWAQSRNDIKLIIFFGQPDEKKNQLIKSRSVNHSFI